MPPNVQNRKQVLLRDVLKREGAGSLRIHYGHFSLNLFQNLSYNLVQNSKILSLNSLNKMFAIKKYKDI